MLRSLGLAHKEGRSLRLRKANSPPCSTAGGEVEVSLAFPLPSPPPAVLQGGDPAVLQGQVCGGGVKIIRRLAAL
jgi:hypothetical protein